MIIKAQFWGRVRACVLVHTLVVVCGVQSSKLVEVISFGFCRTLLTFCRPFFARNQRRELARRPRLSRQSLLLTRVDVAERAARARSEVGRARRERDQDLGGRLTKQLGNRASDPLREIAQTRRVGPDRRDGLTRGSTS
eukprot:6208022-Pleurochrysis_carterae.AAC.7